ncbi:MAG: Txe/YoeB family addiction module toxin [Rhizobium sp.]|nr:Txe/YoeB family addiction module toxin [Rhizobium sp.]
MQLAFTEDAWADYLFWQETDRRMLERINDLLRDTLRHPFSGIGKPEPMKGSLKGFWSRRINLEHRLVYRVIDRDGEQVLVVAQCRYHY